MAGKGPSGTGGSDEDRHDRDLVRRIAEGDEVAFAELVDRHRDRVLGIAWRFLGNMADAEDVAQEVFLAVHRAAGRWRPHARFTTWLYVVVRNACLRVSRGRERRREVEPGGERGKEILDARPDPRPDAEERMIQRERLARIRRAVAELPEGQRMALLLRRFGGLSYEDLAIVLGCSPRAARIRVHRARFALARKLAGADEEGSRP